MYMRARTCVGDFSFQVRGRWWMSRDLVGPEGAVFKNGNLGELWCVAEGARSATVSQIISVCYRVIKQLALGSSSVGPAQLGISGGGGWWT